MDSLVIALVDIWLSKNHLSPEALIYMLLLITSIVGSEILFEFVRAIVIPDMLFLNNLFKMIPNWTPDMTCHY